MTNFRIGRRTVGRIEDPVDPGDHGVGIAHSESLQGCSLFVDHFEDPVDPEDHGMGIAHSEKFARMFLIADSNMTQSRRDHLPLSSRL